MDTTPPLRQLQQTFGVLFDGCVPVVMGSPFFVWIPYPADHWGLKSFPSVCIIPLPPAKVLILRKTQFRKHDHCVRGLHVRIIETLAHGPMILTIRKIRLRSDLEIYLMVCTPSPPSTYPINIEHWVSLALSLACTFTGIASLSMFIGFNQYSRKSAHLRPVVSPEWFDSVSVSLLARGLLAVLIQLGCLATFLALPHKIYWTPLYFVGAKVIINGPLYMLNLRDRVHGKGINEEDSVQRSVTGPGFLSTTSTNTLSNMFKAAPYSSNVVNISRTVEFDPDATVDLAKTGYGSDHGHAARRSFEDGQKRAEAF
ncbi:hypothetical protein B0H17DRAFT_1129205 [Mycena rosella]|uniref:Uncharacterized protein n=1 Tax=Mycena rosella TaxID=1033263 RepID=A0AAD7DVZ5_MYCRO|nr:hypothetical protein B0H17DRAFT_1129205 [Mycena rosella]